MYYQRRFARPKISEIEDDSVRQQAIQRDVQMNNVLNWSIAKNVPALDFPNFERVQNRRHSVGKNLYKKIFVLMY